MVLPVRKMLKFTYEDYLLMPEERRYELIEGELYMTPSPVPYHQKVVGNLYLILRDFVDRRGLGEVIIAPCDVVLSEYDVVQPDLMFISRERMEIIKERNVCGAPDLVIEVLSEGTAERDRVLKKKLYARAGVKEYWIVDPYRKEIEVYELGKRGYRLKGVYREEEEVRSEVLKGLKLRVSEIF